MAKTILVVDDKESVRTLVADYLMAEGFRVVCAENGRVALGVARQEKPDLILLDIMMPEMDGYEFVRATAGSTSPPSSCSPHGWKRPTRCWGWSWGPMTT